MGAEIDRRLHGPGARNRPAEDATPLPAAPHKAPEATGQKAAQDNPLREPVKITSQALQITTPCIQSCTTS
jgi:hypothetical protein